jgi:hypothetical protein
LRRERQMNECSENQWTAAMRAGDFSRAWAVNARDLAQLIARRAPKHEGPRHLQQIWRGEPLQGARVLVRCYHGLGDTLQFIRFVRPLRTIAREVTVWAQPELLELISRCEGVDRAIPLHDGTPEVGFDADIEIMELPFVLRINEHDAAADVPYIKPAQEVSRAAPFDRKFLHVGLVWTAGDWDTRRSIPLAALAPLADLPHVKLYRLQAHMSGEAPAPFALCDLTSPAIAGVAANIRKLDLVITVDTMMAHLAGAMGVPVWTMLAKPCDWRWMDARPSSIWYPSMRLFRQVAASDWSSVVDAVVRELRALQPRMFAGEHGNGRQAPQL